LFLHICDMFVEFGYIWSVWLCGRVIELFYYSFYFLYTFVHFLRCRFLCCDGCFYLAHLLLVGGGSCGPLGRRGFLVCFVFHFGSPVY
jgi:hypothetical protein